MARWWSQPFRPRSLSVIRRHLRSALAECGATDVRLNHAVTFLDARGELGHARASIVLGCDGANSEVRKLIGATLVGSDFTDTWLSTSTCTASGTQLKSWPPLFGSPPQLARAHPEVTRILNRRGLQHIHSEIGLAPRALRDVEEGVASGRFDVPDPLVALSALGEGQLALWELRSARPDVSADEARLTWRK